ncbi:MAG: hypothetical protein ABL926_08760 [Novosphingobium sp.]|uniref:hypothetical protein n=1 Tax=Novosphingobium sp. TaxID=1874826 RepID=UPI0032B8327C
MSESKPLASLSPRLLARKGGARPAMRPQLGALQADSLARQIDDLGWNDMGHDNDEAMDGADVVSIAHDAALPADHEPAVVRQQRAISRRIAAERRSALADGRRAAFTLRVDADRHLKLRLACTLNGRSAQQLVTDALDRLLEELPDVAALAAQVAKRPRKS